MALPAGVTTANLTVGAPVSFSGLPIRSSVQIVPSAFLVHSATGIPLVNLIEETATLESVVGQFTLPHTDQAGFQDENGNAYTNWYYTATINYSTDRGPVGKPLNKVFQLPSGQTVVDLDLLPGGAPAMAYSAPVATVTSVAGLTGAITGSQIISAPEVQTELSATYENKTDAGAKYASRARDAGDTFQSWTRRINLIDQANSPGSMLNMEHNADGTGPTDPSSVNETYALDIHNNPGAPPAIVIHQYSDNLQAMRIDNTDSSPAIVVFNTQNQTRNPGNVGTGDFLYLSDLMNNTDDKRRLASELLALL